MKEKEYDVLFARIKKAEYKENINYNKSLNKLKWISVSFLFIFSLIWFGLLFFPMVGNK